MLPDGGVRQSNPEVLAYYILNQDPQLEGRRIQLLRKTGNITYNPTSDWDNLYKSS